MNKKPSFLERLTGVLEEEENAKIELNQTKTAPSTERMIDATNDEEVDEKTKPAERRASEKEKNKNIEAGRKEKKISPADSERAAEDWLPDAEGQLTIDVYQTPTDIVIKSTIAGVSPDDLDITITNDMVTIKGRREKDEVISTGDYYYQECYWGAFSRSVILPVDVEAEKADASMKNGILTLRLPKIEKIKTKKIRVISS